MKKIVLIFSAVILVTASLVAQDLRKKAEDNPLDCHFYLLSKDNLNNFDDINRLAFTFLELGQYQKVKKSIELLKYQSDRFSGFVMFSTKLLKEGKPKEANNFLNFALANLDKKDSPQIRSFIEFVDNLVRINRVNDAQKVLDTFKDETEVEEVSIKFAFSLLQNRKKSEALKFTNKPYFPLNSKDNEILANLALIYAKLNQKEKATKILNEFEENFALIAENTRRNILPNLLQSYLHINQTEQAIKFWNQYGNNEFYYEISGFINQLIDYGQNQKALELAQQMLANKDEFESKGSYVVSIFLRLGEIEKAFSTAQNISNKNDNYSQQEAFMKLADRFIDQKNFKKAVKILDLALKKAKQIDFKHASMQSNGASAGTRKRTYLWNIYSRFMKLKEFDKAFLAINSINSQHPIAIEFIATKNIEFAKHQINILPKTKILEMLNQSKNLIKDEEEFYPIEVKLLTAEIYGLMGDKIEATELLAQVLNEAKESCCYQNEFLISVGKLFEQHKLKPTPNLQKALKNIIESHN